MDSPNPARVDGVLAPAQHSRGSIEGATQAPFPVVGIGASAGGLEAYMQLLAALPARSGMAFVLVQHLDPHHESKLPQLLAKSAAIPVSEIVHGMELAPDHAYVIAPNTDVAMEDGRLRVTAREHGRGPHLPIDHFFRSLAASHEARAVGVVLSGTGADGTLGLAEIKAVGGVTFAQDEESARHSGMPHSAAESGSVDFVLPPPLIAGRLAEIGGHPYFGAPLDRVSVDEEQFKKILAVVHSITRVDFSQYRESTIKRRILRRMALRGEPSLVDYAKRLGRDLHEVEALYHDLLINVTSFFRDAELFEALKERVYPKFLEGRVPSDPIRIWVPGCSTGQEAYSVAISLLEFLDTAPVRPPIQIFATDLSDLTALDRARNGRYPESIEAEVSPERLRRFFKREDHIYRIDKSVRDLCVFARQNVAADPPFSHLDLITCRNVLIYLAPPLQRRVLPTFHYSLNPTGFLVLGTAETIGENADLFEAVDRTNKIYAKKTTASRPFVQFPPDEFRSLPTNPVRRVGAGQSSPADYQREADRLLLGRFAPAGVLVNDNLDVLQYRGRTSAFLEAPAGEPTKSILKMAREGLFLELRSALGEAKRTGQPVRRDRVRVRADGGVHEIDLEVIPIRPPGVPDGCSLVLFHERPASGTGEAVPPRPPSESREPSEVELAQLRQELTAIKDDLQSLVEQQDAANEELRSANEEILSSNEELQSTNEELETAKEELQSANEELTTVNEQLQQRNLELSQVNNDLSNLLSSTNIPLIMVGGDLRIRRFTPPASKLMRLLPSDVNRPVGDIKSTLLAEDLETRIVSVIESAQPSQREVQDRTGRWHELRIFPYRTEDHGIDGAVIVLVDIDEHKRAEDTLREADRRKDEFLATLAHELRNPIAPIRNAVEILRMAGDNPSTIAQANEVLGRQVRQLSRIVEDLIDVSRIVERKIELHPRLVDVSSVIETAVETCRSYVESCQHTLEVALPKTPLYLYADPVRLAQILVNLLNNAVKFTRHGGHIWLSAERSPEARPGRPHGELVLRMRDSGVGISAALLPHVFEMFTQGEETLEGGRAGLGVGLTLVRSLVEMHGGSVEPTSPGAGLGSEFIVRLPLAVPPASTTAGHEPARTLERAASARRILVVDDNVDQALSLGTLLRLIGHEVRIAHDGAAALAIAQEFRPEVGLIDIGLPGLNGYDLARKIRELPDLRGMILVAQTGWGQEEDRRRSREAGFDHHLVKPLNPEELQKVIGVAGAS